MRQSPFSILPYTAQQSQGIVVLFSSLITALLTSTHRQLARSSPASKRNIKPSHISPAQPQYPLADASGLPPLGLQPLSSPADAFSAFAQPPSPTNSRKRRASGQQIPQSIAPATATGPLPNAYAPSPTHMQPPIVPTAPMAAVPDPETPAQPPPKKGRTNTPWTPAEEQRLKQMRDAGNSWSEIAKVRDLCRRSRRTARGKEI